MHPPFLVLGLPRSRTYWLSRFLTYREFACGHDQAPYLRSLADVKSWLAQDCVGSAETSVVRWWKLAKHFRPGLRIVVVRRPVEEAVESVMRLDMYGVCNFNRKKLTTEFHRMDRALNRIEEECSDMMSVGYADLQDEAVCAAIFEYCLPYDHDHQHWATLDRQNLQCHMPGLMRYMFAHQKQISAFGQECLRHYRALIEPPQSNWQPVDHESITYQTEPFEDFWRDGQALFAEHAKEVGPRNGATLRPNLTLARNLDKIGAAQILTARYDGEMVGYLATIISPSLEDETMVSATQNTFFVTKRFRGIGPRMQEESIARLRARGVGELAIRAGVRGSGRKMAALARRMGAVEFGEMFLLPLKAA